MKDLPKDWQQKLRNAGRSARPLSAGAMALPRTVGHPAECDCVGCNSIRHTWALALQRGVKTEAEVAAYYEERHGPAVEAERELPDPVEAGGEAAARADGGGDGRVAVGGDPEGFEPVEGFDEE